MDARDKRGHYDCFERRRFMPTSSSSKLTSPGASQRQLRVGETRAPRDRRYSGAGHVHDPVLEGHLITVPEVRMSPDLKLATIYVMPLGGRDTDRRDRGARPQQEIPARRDGAHRVNLKFAPDLRFRIDERFDEAERIEKLLRTPAVQRDLDRFGRKVDDDDQPRRTA